jgi:hypothetical protein
VDARGAEGLFWDEAFAWAPLAGEPEPALPPELGEAAERVRARTEALRARRLARSRAAQRRRRLRLYPLCAAAALALGALALLTTRGGEAPAGSPADTPPPPA